MAIGDTYELAIKATCLSQQIVATHHLRAEGAGDMSTVIPTAWNTSLKASWLASLPTIYSLSILACRQINPPGPVGVEFTPTGTITGNVNTAISTLVLAGVIKWTSAYVGRSRRGRTFVGPLTADSAVNGTLIAGRVTQLQAYVTAMLALWGPGGTGVADARLVIWSRTIADSTSQSPPPAMGNVLSASAYVTAGNAQAIARTQRRRELGVGS